MGAFFILIGLEFVDRHRRCIIILKKFDRRLPSKNDNTEINEMIKDKEVRVIDEDGNQLGIMSADEALDIAVEKKLDLVKIAAQANPPVCKIMDYGKYRYEQQKREKENRKNQKTLSVKEIRISVGIDNHDIETKAKSAIKFLSAGDKVKVNLRLRGREMGNTELAIAVVQKFCEAVGDAANVDYAPKLEGRSIVTSLSPK